MFLMCTSPKLFTLLPLPRSPLSRSARSRSCLHLKSRSRAKREIPLPGAYIMPWSGFIRPHVSSVSTFPVALPCISLPDKSTRKRLSPLLLARTETMFVGSLTTLSSEFFSSLIPQRCPHSLRDTLRFAHCSIKVVMLGHTAQSLEIGDLPIVSFDMRATHLFRRMRDAMKNIKPTILGWKPKPGSGWQVGVRLFKLNAFVILLEMWLAAFTAVLFYSPAFFLRSLVAYLESDPLRLHRGWGVVFALGLFVSGVILSLGGSLVHKITRLQMLNTPTQHPANSGLSVPRLSRSGCACNSILSYFPRLWSERMSLLLGLVTQRGTRIAKRTDQPSKGLLKRQP